MLGFVHNLNSQNNCSSSVNISPTNTCDFSGHTTNSQEYWLDFNATSEYVNITLETTKFGLNETHIHGIELYSGNCGSLNLLADDDLVEHISKEEVEQIFDYAYHLKNIGVIYQRLGLE